MEKHPVNSLSIFFPCYNEEGNIEKLINKSLAVAGAIGVDYEIIIVNDGSIDKTGEIAERLAVENPGVRVVHHKKNSGYGAALQSGFRAARKDYVFYTDGDGQFDIADMPALLGHMSDYDIVSCYRIKRQDNIIRKINAFCWTTLVSMMFNLKLRDIDCAFKLYKREIFDGMNLISTGALIDTEVLSRAKADGRTIYQTGVNHYPRLVGESSGGDIKVVLRAFKELFKLYRLMKSECSQA